MADPPDPIPVLAYGRPTRSRVPRPTRDRAKLLARHLGQLAAGVALCLPLAIGFLAGLAGTVAGNALFCCGVPAVAGLVCVGLGLRGCYRLGPTNVPID